MSRYDYSKFSKPTAKHNLDQKPYVGEVGTDNEASMIPDPVDPVIESKIGIVVDCLRLNLRSEPSTDSEVIRTIDSSAELVVYENESTDEFYKVCLADGNEGYCMKKFIKIL